MPTSHETRSSWGGPPDLSAWEALMWRAEGDHRTRSTGVVVELLESEPDWERLVLAHKRLTQRIPRLRERVVEPLLPLVAPAWSPDLDFDLDCHLQHVRAPREGSIEEMLALAAAFAGRPLDPNRPPWEAMLISGLADGGAAYLLKLHHSLCDGLGMLQLLDLTHGHGPEPSEIDAAPVPAARRVETPHGLLADRLGARIASAPGELLRSSADLIGRGLTDPIGAAAGVIRFGQSLRRVLNPPDAPRSPALGAGGTSYRLLTHDVPLATLKAAGKACGGSANDAFLAGLLGAFRHYHDHVGTFVERMPIGMPISLRTDRDPMGGNKFAGARFAAPVAEPDPRARIVMIHDVVARARVEPAIGFLDLLAPVMSRLPGMVLTELSSEMTGVCDLQASNLGGIGRAFYIAGARVSRVYPIGPRPGVAAMVTVVSYEGMCCVGVNLDPDAITDVAAFANCLRAGFDEVLALAD
ncbi:wax ester/triacylglycerol synthase domain-containing protein [Nocardia sp. NPDC004860]|uniref:wax ester/triacylglycerol synthase domain-containing protein n=1 Tax=Nocardia sp. NPDC004860 TaxID=3154557 RepID=UPI0033B12746